MVPTFAPSLFPIAAVIRKNGPFRDVVVGSLPFVAVMPVMIVLLTVFPSMALWLPSVFAAGRS